MTSSFALHRALVTTPRNIVMPVVFSVVLLSFIVTCFPLLVLPSQFTRWEHYLSMDSWSHGARAFRHVFRFGPVVSALLLGVGCSLLRHRECSTSRLAWYTAVATVILALWTFWTLGVLHSFYESSQPA